MRQKAPSEGGLGLVSVVVLTHDRPAKLRRCVISLMEQEIAANFEILVVDDGSGAETRRATASLAESDDRIRIVRQPHRGIPAARNLGVSEAKGDVIAIVADDYVLDRHYLRDALSYLAEHPEAAAVRFRIQPLDDTFGSRVSHCYYEFSILYRLELERDSRFRFRGEPRDSVPAAGPTRTLEASGAAIFRAEVFDVVGGFDEHLQRGEDTEFTTRFRQAGFELHFSGESRVYHDYARWPFDTLRKCLLTGYWREMLLTTGVGAKSETSRWRALARKLFGVRHAFHRARFAPNRLSYFLYLPWLILFELATLAGHAAAWCHKPFRPAATAPASRPDSRADTPEQRSE